MNHCPIRWSQFSTDLKHSICVSLGAWHGMDTHGLVFQGDFVSKGSHGLALNSSSHLLPHRVICLKSGAREPSCSPACLLPWTILQPVQVMGNLEAVMEVLAVISSPLPLAQFQLLLQIPFLHHLPSVASCEHFTKFQYPCNCCFKGSIKDLYGNKKPLV